MWLLPIAIMEVIAPIGCCWASPIDMNTPIIAPWIPAGLAHDCNSKTAEGSLGTLATL